MNDGFLVISDWFIENEGPWPELKRRPLMVGFWDHPNLGRWVVERSRGREIGD